MDINDFNFDNFEIPAIAKGQIVPYSVERKLMEEEKERAERKRDRRHDWLIAIFGVVGGTVGGAISSLVVYVLTR